MKATAGQLEQPSNLAAWQHGVIFVAACLVLFTRRPEALLHAQFYAEDGHVWYAEAYNLGWWHAVWRAQDGYFQTFSRLGAALALVTPLIWAPLTMNVMALAAQALPVNLMMSRRSAGWGDLRFRALLSLVYLGLPNAGEMGFGITESQWLLALGAFLLLAASAPRRWIGRGFDLGFLFLSGLSGPFCIFLLPVAVFVAWKRRKRWAWLPAGVVAGCVVVQAYALLVIDRSGRPHFPLGAGFALLVRIFGGNVIMGAIVGRAPLAAMPGRGMPIFLLCASIAGFAIAAVCFLKAPMGLRLFIAMAGTMFVAAMLSPATYPPAGTTVWELLAQAAGVRYWVFPSLAFAWSLVWCVREGSPVVKAASVLLICAMCVGAVPNWKHPSLRNLNFAEYAASFEVAPAGTVMVMPENPQGWNMRLVKHASR